MSEPRRYRMVDVDHDGVFTRVLVVKRHGFEGYVRRWTESCSGCCEIGDYGSGSSNYRYDDKAQCLVGSGCDECGHTGKHRVTMFFAFDETAFEAWLDKRYARRERLLAFWRRAA